ncbi:MAG: acetyl-CoA acetyltransferase [Pseudomonadota bacterium]|nr:acetyl-CoA acetyltransferase [Pseudomonadota bacterium]
MARDIFILGGSQTDFARNWAREGAGLYELMEAAVRDGLADASVEPGQIEVAHIGNFAGEMFAGQGMLGGFMGHIDPAFEGLPTSRHEAACASGSMAILAAMADLESERYGMAAVVGVELMKNVPGQTAAENLGAAAWAGQEAEGARYLWPAMFSDVAEEYDARFGLERDHLAEISRINFANAKRNPLAQTRGWAFTDESFGENDEANPVIEGRMRKSDCGQVTDGAAMLVLANAERAAEHARRTGQSLDDLPRIKGWGHTTAPLKLKTKLAASRGSNDGYMFPWMRKAMTDAYARAGISGPDDVDAFETHDCFSITELVAIEHFGIAPPGRAREAIERGAIAADGACPVNPSGGLIGLGHPVGATGVRMALDAARQTTGRAGDCQVEGARTIATFNVGGSATANVSMVIGR